MKQKKITVVIAVVLVVLLLVSIGMLIYLVDQASAEQARLNSIIGELDGEKAYLEGEIVKSNKEKDLLEEKLKLGAEDYMNQISDLENKLSENSAYTDKLLSELNKRKEQKGIDLAYYASRFSELEKYIDTSSPVLRVMLSEQELENAKKTAEENDKDPDSIWDHRWENKEKHEQQALEKLGEEMISELTLKQMLQSAESEAEYPEISIYYKDLVNGYIYTYNADKVVDAASVMKAPYITAVLDAVAKYENGEIETNEDDKFYNQENIDVIFDLSERVILDHDTMDKDGSGELKDKPDGTELTYEELFRLSLEKSDNIAFGIIKNKFTNRWYYELASKLGVKSPMGYEMNLTAREAGKLFEEIYYFTLTNPKYGQLVKESMQISAHTVLSKSVLGADSTHKYGWDENAYNDAAIVYGEHPYVVVVFTNMDCGGRATDEYIRGIFKRINAIHRELNA